ncbi:hypothetical protein [Azospirillum picis]|uniref:Uncharacterized protein n=1 Tax=Azospirillum picis TaxID=488438 RepID=A0ABU0MK61_9PROT|nr:hypothetical protein [Azospirillum picis]MBP2299929.1 hypothetical protein [Azospirillum picis]MDQ0533833.1 hypothetical protein [Azospirillum picis]
MLPAHLADRLLKQRRAAETAEFARQLPLHADDPRWLTDPAETGAAETGQESLQAPRWATDY